MHPSICYSGTFMKFERETKTRYYKGLLSILNRGLQDLLVWQKAILQLFFLIWQEIFKNVPRAIKNSFWPQKLL